MSIYQLSRAIASFENKAQLDRHVEYLALVKDIQLDKAVIDALWRDVQAVPKGRGL